jgi:glucose-1-phosphate thymidylyltransferase
MKGIVLAGGTGSRLWPLTKSISKQLLPIYDKPMIHYPISTLMLAGIRDILIISTPQDQESFMNLLGDGKELGVNFHFQTQDAPRGLAEALIIANEFLNGDKCMMILGDNIFHGNGFGQSLQNFTEVSGAHIFLYEVSTPSDYGIAELDENEGIISLHEKPIKPKSNLAITGLYVFDSLASEIAKQVLPSHRGELEITSVLEMYLQQKCLNYNRMSRGTAWLDTGNFNSLHDAATYIRVLEERTGLKVACLEEIAWRNGWISSQELKYIANLEKNKNIKEYLLKISI